MSFVPPSPAEIRVIGREFGCDMSDAEAADLRSFLAPLLMSYEYLDAEADEIPLLKYPDRSWQIPAAGDNPLGAWYVRTRIKAAASGRLKGRSVAIKDNIFLAGVPMMNGSALLEGFVPDFDATAVTRLLDAGADIAGKSVCEHLCVSSGSLTASTGLVRNPRRPAYSAGGSSSGCAALVAAAHVDMALGCDQAGSIRIPSSLCGIYGMKPTFGLVPYTGIMGMETSLDHVGPMTANVADNALLLEVLAGHDGYDGRQQELAVHKYPDALGRGVAGMHIGVLREGFGQADSAPAVDQCVRAAADRLRQLGATVAEVSVPGHLSGVGIWGGVVGDGLWQTLKLNGLGYNYRGVYSPALHAAMDGWPARLAETPVNFQMIIFMGRYLERYRGRYYAKAKNLERRLRAAYEAELAHCDLLLLPTTRSQARPNPPSLEQATPAQIVEHAFSNLANTCPFNVSGHPAMSIPCGLRDQLPVGMMLVGHHFDEPAIYRAAHAFEQSGDWQSM
ncbi:MAG TPA: amidase [Xanthomonadales bacterium]|nr:amidase [Xanthomonadales bacterium]